MNNKVSNIPSEYGTNITLAGRNKLILISPSPLQGRGSNGKVNYFSKGGYYG